MQPPLGQPKLSAAAIATLALSVRTRDCLTSKFQTVPYIQALSSSLIFLAEAGGAHRPKPTTNLKEKKK